jgi:hypothetical protein
MSYEGYTEYLCTRGHYMTRDCRDDRPLQCDVCNLAIEYQNSVDQTNGETEHACTRPGKKIEFGFEDDWHVDHYGNRYAIKIPRYTPASTLWKIIPRHTQTPESVQTTFTIHFIKLEDADTFVLTEYDPSTHQFEVGRSEDSPVRYVFDSEAEVDVAMSHILLSYNQHNNNTWRDYWDDIEVVRL